MKNVILFMLLLSVIFNARAQDLTIFFQPKVSGTPIDSIRVTNLRTNQSVKLTGSETLLLVKPTGINPVRAYSEAGFVFSNPTDKEATLRFFTNKSQEVEISLFNVIGQLLGIQKQSLTQGMHQYQLNFPIAGVYYVSVNKSEGNESFKVIYYGEETQSSSIKYSGSENFNAPIADVNFLKSANNSKSLTFKVGDIIKYSISSGVNTTIISETPITSKTILAEFVSCIDKDNRSYKTVKIGDQWWMAENLSVGKVVIGDGNANQLDNNVIEKYSYQNLESNLNKYGGLYQWDEMMDHVGEVSGKVKGICPNGWHLPSKDEWLTLFNSVGGKDVAGKKLKSASGYNNSGNGSDEYGFNALPSGMYVWDGKQPQLLKFMGLGDYSVFYTSTSINHLVSYTGFSSITNLSFMEEMEFWGYGMCVRCVLDSGTSPSQFAPVADFTASKTNIMKGETIQFTDKSTNIPTGWLWNFGDGTTSSQQNPTKIYNSSGTFTASLQAINSFGNNTKTITITVTEPVGAGTLVFEGRTYKTVIINKKEWMAENLAYLPAVYPPSNGSNTEPRYYVYSYQGTDVTAAKATPNYTNYGVLYNWPAAKAACPPGWHLPSDAEWTALENYLIANGYNYDGTTTGNKIAKSVAAKTDWIATTVNGAIGNNLALNNKSGFSALPGGLRGSTREFFEVGYYGYWWSSTEVSTVFAWYRYLDRNYYGGLSQGSYTDKEGGLSVRCVRD